MRLLIKYELKRTYKIFLLLLVVTFLLNIVFVFMEIRELIPEGKFTSMLYLGTFSWFFMYAVNGFKKYLNKERGYLRFILPIKESKVIFSKFIILFIWFVCIGIIILLCILSHEVIKALTNLNLMKQLFEYITSAKFYDKPLYKVF